MAKRVGTTRGVGLGLEWPRRILRITVLVHQRMQQVSRLFVQMGAPVENARKLSRPDRIHSRFAKDETFNRRRNLFSHAISMIGDSDSDRTSPWQSDHCSTLATGYCFLRW